MPTASVQALRLVLAVAAARGVAPPRLLAAVGVAPEQLLSPDGRLPAELAVRAWNLAAELCGDATFGLNAVDHLGPDFAGGLGWAIHASPTFGAGLGRMALFLRLVNQYQTVRLIEDGDRVRVRLEVLHEVDPEQVRHQHECLLASVLRVGQRAAGRPLVPLAAAFRHRAPPGALAEAYLRHFGGAPAFSQPATELVLARAALDREHLAPDPALIATTERHLRRLLEELPAVETFTSQVQRVLAEELRHGEPNMNKLARRMRLSERTLQRRLRQEGTSVHDLLEDLRHRLALRYLREPRESIAEISFVLGYAEVRAFHRAFKRWTGLTPGAFRERALGAAAGGG